jgi:predicted transcriptional regulator
MPSEYKKKEVRRTEEGFYICDKCGGYFEESEMTRGRFGVIGICKSCTGKAHSEGAKKRKQKQDAMSQEIQDLRMEIAELKRQIKEKADNALSHATGRELLIELKNRGYEGQFTVVTRKTIDLSKLD